MRPNHRYTALHVFILAGLLLTLKAEDCEDETQVPADTVYEVVVGAELRLNCTIQFCNAPPPPVSWYKYETTNISIVSSSSRIKIKWELLKPLVGTSLLIFQKVRRNDSGLYQCTIKESTSHNINVSVLGVRERANVTKNNDASGTTHEHTGYLWLYVAAGVGAMVIIVIIISVLSMHGWKGKSKKETGTENQYMVIPMVERPAPLATGPQPLPRGSPATPPSRRSGRGKAAPSQPDVAASPRGDEGAYGRMGEEVGGSLVYSALNHQLAAAAAAARPRRPGEAASEYAAIRVNQPQY